LDSTLQQEETYSDTESADEQPYHIFEVRVSEEDLVEFQELAGATTDQIERLRSGLGISGRGSGRGRRKRISKRGRYELGMAYLLRGANGDADSDSESVYYA